MKTVLVILMLASCAGSATTPDAGSTLELGILYLTASTTQPDGWQEESVSVMLPSEFDDLVVLPVGSDGLVHAIRVVRNFTP